MTEFLTRRGNITSWVVALAICLIILAFGLLSRFGSQPTSLTENESVGTELDKSILPRTNQLATRKQFSLESYNREMPLSELLEALRRHTNKEFQEQAYEQLDRRMLADVVERLWRESSARSEDTLQVSHHAMVSVLQEQFPHQTLTNADVLLFPEDSRLRDVVAEPASDFFRDTARHWKWIAQFSKGATSTDLPELKELDAYAAEELSEFVSVLAIGVAQMAARVSDDNTIEPSEVDTVFDSFAKYSPDITIPRRPEVKYSEIRKQELIASLPKPMFTDITKETQIAYAHRPNSELQLKRIELEVPLGIAGGGVSAVDFDGDGKTDLYFAGDGAGALFKNAGATFEDVSESAGLPRTGETRAGYFVDFDNDGDQDLFLTFVGSRNRLLENDGSGKFTDVSSDVGLIDEPLVSHEAVWFDMNNDGLLDLYVANFGDWVNGASPTLGRINESAPPNRLYRHELENGEHKFVEAGKELGIDDRGWTHCVGAYDYDHDGWQDLFSINDFGTSFVFRNLEGQGFKESSRDVRIDDVYNGMSFSLLDLNHDSNFSIYVTQIMKLVHRQRYSRPSEATPIQFDIEKKDNLRIIVENRLFSKAFQTAFRDDHDYLIEPANFGWAWDASGLDYENDSDIDLLVLNGTESGTPENRRVNDPAYRSGRKFLTKFNFEQNVMHLQDEGYFYDVSAGNPVAFYGNSRGSSYFDFDGDGDLDVVISNFNDEPKLFQNNQKSGNSWIRLKLTGTKSNRNAIGAVVEVRFGSQVRYGVVTSGKGFLSQNPYELHFGLGDTAAVDKVIVRWPAGKAEEFENLELNKLHELTEGE